jgi:hypothetical protein
MSSLRNQVRSKKYLDEVFVALGLEVKPRYGRQEFETLRDLIGQRYVGGIGTQIKINQAIADLEGGEPDPEPEPEPEPVVAVYVDSIFATGSTPFATSAEICNLGDVSDLDNFDPKVLVYAPLGGEFETVFEVGDFVYLDEEFETPVGEGFIASYIDGTWNIIEVGEDGEILFIDEFDEVCIIE